MPIYEYKCRQCGDKFEKLVRSAASEVDLKCPVCQSSKVERQVSLFGSLSGGSGDFGGASATSSSCAPSGGG